MSGFDSKSRWVCPNDRELTLRARLDAGWSVKTGTVNTTANKTEQTINESEQEAILKVIRKAQQVELMEKERIHRMMDKLNNMKRNAKGDGKSRCILCNDDFGIFGTQCHVCKDCNKCVCNKCGVDTYNQDNEPVWFCKICSETREMWKKSGAWYLNSLPAHSSQKHSIPMIKSPILSSIKDSSGKTVEPPSSPMVRRRQRSPSPMRHRNRSPEIADYSTVFDHRKKEDEVMNTEQSMNKQSDLSKSNSSLFYYEGNY